MPGVVRRTTVALIALAALAAACGDGGAGPASPPSGSLGPVTSAAADEAVLGLCAMVGETNAGAAEATFHDRSHQTLHAIAAAAEEVDRAAAADLLVAKQQVESDLAGTTLPGSFRADVEALLGRTRAALEALGLDPPGCPA
jgi:hypothetical protein